MSLDVVMYPAGLSRLGSATAKFPLRAWRRGLAFLMAAYAALFIIVLVSNIQNRTSVLTLSVSLIVCSGVFVLAWSLFLRGVHQEQSVTTTELLVTKEEFHHIAENIQEVFWMIDANTNKVLYVNAAYEVITGCTSKSLIENTISCLELIHADDRAYLISKWNEALQSGRFDEEFRITKSLGDIRWVWVRGFPERDPEGNLVRLVGTALDITGQKQAEQQVAENLAIAKSAWAEEEALRKATLSLTQDLHMDKVMAALLRSLAEVVPYTSARVIVPEGGPHWLALGERVLPEQPQTSPRVPWTFVDDRCGATSPISDRKNEHSDR